MNIGALSRMMQEMLKQNPPVSTKAVSIDSVYITAERTAQAFQAATEQLQEKIPFVVPENYDLVGLRDEVLRKIAAARACNRKTIILGMAALLCERAN